MGASSVGRGLLTMFSPTRAYCESVPEAAGPPKQHRIENFEEKAFRKVCTF